MAATRGAPPLISCIGPYSHNFFLIEFITICIAQNVQTYLNALNSNKTW